MNTIYILLLISSFGLSASLVAIILPKLKRIAKQPIYEEGPGWHMKKAGTPTMGGVCFLASILLGLLFIFFFQRSLLSGTEGIILLIDLLFILLHGTIGIYDDLKKIRNRHNEGLTPKEKLLYQTLLCALYLFARARLTHFGTAIYIGDIKLSLGLLFYPMMLFVMLGIINCANLTDGIDGLASTVSVTLGIVFFFISRASSMYASMLSILMCGAVLGFLIFNRHPAKIFMGDSGSLSLGAISICLAFSLKNPFLILLFGVVYVIEGFSVVLQVLHFKRTRKRLFRMSPLHHHFEMCGMSEGIICIVACATTVIFSLIAALLR